MTSRAPYAVACTLALGVQACGSPGATNQPTRTPTAGHVSIAVAQELPLLVGKASRGSAAARSTEEEQSTVERTARDVGAFIPRTRPSVHYAFTDRLAAGLQGNVAFSLQALGTWNPVRTRWVDASVRIGVGYEQCAIVTSRWCQQDALADFVFHAEALGSLGFNPSERVTVQLTAGPILQRGADTRVLAWTQLDAYVFITRQVGLGPSVLVLPRWQPDGRWIVAPALSVLVYPGDANPYLKDRK